MVTGYGISMVTWVMCFSHNEFNFNNELQLTNIDQNKVILIVRTNLQTAIEIFRYV